MCRFIETICFENGEYPLLDLHQERVNRAFVSHFPGKPPHDLTQVLPWPEATGRQKVRMVYDVDILEISVTAHVTRNVRKILLLEGRTVEYAHKYEDRGELQQLFDQRGEADEILILKDGWVTDSFYANPAFWDGHSWYVPKTCLLDGVRRQHLLREGNVKMADISAQDLSDFQKVALVNALVDLGECVLGAREGILR